VERCDQNVTGELPETNPEGSPEIPRQKEPNPAPRAGLENLERGDDGKKARASDRRRRAVRLARKVLRDFPPEMMAQRLIRDQVVMWAQMRVLFSDTFDRLARVNPIDNRGEPKEGLKWLTETYDRTANSLRSILREWPVPPVAEEPKQVIHEHLVTYLNPPKDQKSLTTPAESEALESSAEEATTEEDKLNVPEKSLRERIGAALKGKRKPRPSPEPKVSSQPTRSPSEPTLAQRYGWRNVTGDGDEDW
jgi:hypothetical protein